MSKKNNYWLFLAILSIINIIVYTFLIFLASDNDNVYIFILVCSIILCYFSITAYRNKIGLTISEKFSDETHHHILRVS